jgi:hypothetical protein
MASIIRIKRSGVAGNPTVLAAGELAYSALTDNGSNGGDRLYIGIGTETAGDAANHFVIGGKFFTDRLDHTAGTLTALSALVVDSNSKIDNFLVDNLQLDGNTLSTTNTNGNLLITPNGTGKTVITNLHIGDDATSIAEFIYDTIGGAITAGTGITITNSDIDNTSTVSITNTTVTGAGTPVGSSTAIPVITYNAQGQLTAVTTASISTSLSIAGDTGTDSVSLADDTLTFVGGTGITSTVTNNTVTMDIDSTVATLTGTQTLTNKTINLENNTLTATSAQLATAISDETGTGFVVFSNTPTLVTPNIGAATASSITGTAGNLTITAFAGNNSVNLVPTGTGTVDVASKRITSLADPTQAQDAATKAYVDAVKTGLDIKDSVRATTTTNITLSGTQTIDGVAVIAGDRVLVKDQNTGSENGIYVVAAGAWTRAIDFDNTPGIEVTGGAFTFVEEGTANADSGWVLTTNGTITLGTTALTFAQFSGAGQITAGDGLTKTGNTIDAVGTTNRITVNADSIDIASTYVGQTSITTLGTIGTGTWQGTIVGPTYGGTGVNNGTKTITLGGNFTHTGAHTLGLTTTANTSVTLPTTGTLATLAGAESLSNKTITASSIGSSSPSTAAFTTLAASDAVTFTSATDASALGTAAVVLSGGLSVAKSVFVGLNITGAGADTSTLDGFNIDGGTY